MNSYSPRYAKPHKDGNSTSFRWATPIILFALGAAIGSWIWMLTQKDEPLEEVFAIESETPISEPTPIPTVEPTPIPPPTIPTPEPDPYPGW